MKYKKIPRREAKDGVLRGIGAVFRQWRNKNGGDRAWHRASFS